MKKIINIRRIDYVIRLLKYSSNARKIIIILFFKFIAILLSVLSPFFYKLFIDNVLTKHQTQMFLFVLIGYISVYIFEVLNSLVYTNAYTEFINDITRNLKSELLSKFFDMRNKDYQRYSVGDKKNIIENDINVVDNLIGEHFVDYYFQILNALILIIMLSILNWRLTLVSMVMIPLSFKFAKIMASKAKVVSNEYRKQFGEYESFVWNGLENYKEIKSCCLEEKMIIVFFEYWEKLGKLFVKQQILWFLNRVFVSFKDFFIVKMNLYFIGGIMIINGNIELGTLLVFLNYYASFFSAISTVMDRNVQISGQEIKIERICEILNYRVEKLKPIVVNNNFLQIKNVCFHYNDCEDNVLNNISIDIEENKKISIVGRSGCGKTSLMKLIYRCHEPSSGVIELGGINIDLIDPCEYGEIVSVVLQNPCFFNNSIRYNLLLANKDATDDMMYDVLELVGLKEFVCSCKKKLDTVIGEKGVKLSGGQRQRLSLGRAILKNSKILILDEATSALDKQSELKILNTLSKIGINKTIISISHRLSFVYRSDEIFVMENGSVIAKGNHQYLSNNCRLYQEIFGNQFQEIKKYNYS